MPTESELVMPADPRDQPGKQWLVIYEYRSDRSIQPFATIEEAKAEAWRHVDFVAGVSGIDIEDLRAAGDLWGAWEAVSNGEETLDIEQVDLPSSATFAATERPSERPPLRRYVVRCQSTRYFSCDLPVIARDEAEAERIAASRVTAPGFHGWGGADARIATIESIKEVDAGPMHPDDMMRRLSMWGGANA